MAPTPRRNKAIEEVARLRLNQANLASSITWAWGSGVALFLSYIISPANGDWHAAASALRAVLIALVILSLLCTTLFYWNSKQEKKLTRQQIKLFGLSEATAFTQPDQSVVTKSSSGHTGAESSDLR
jgi:hypothetical protein